MNEFLYNRGPCIISTVKTEKKQTCEYWIYIGNILLKFKIMDFSKYFYLTINMREEGGIGHSISYRYGDALLNLI